ncbi:MAG TPA: ABC transporter permease [Candidatus Scybalomonas excrementigallinarum]|nr:ABC transporter permease [Candidatus Scybalomonas excrementigallinarum]
MNKFFYMKLARTNIKKNRKTILPYLFTCIMTTTMFYILCSLSQNQGLMSMPGGGELQLVLSFGKYVIGIFAVIFLFYTNSFLMKQRKKEFGVFNILGLEKRHISKVIAYEILMIAVISIGLGLVFGVLLDKAMYLLLLKLFDAPIVLGFYISQKVLITTVLLFLIIHFLIFLNSIRQIHLANPIELLQSGNYGEREPKNKWIFTILGLLCLVVAYYISITTKNIFAVLGLFFVAVILVMIGTYLLFTSGSITFLKALKSNKNYYYRTKHFISVSSMMYRMKKNAIGLANICILSTMILVVLSTTISLWFGLDDILRTRYPKEFSIEENLKMNDTTSYGESLQNLKEEVKNVVAQQGLSMEEVESYTGLKFSALKENNNFYIDTENQTVEDVSRIYSLYFVLLDDYNTTMGVNDSLEENEILVCTNDEGEKEEELNLLDQTFLVKQYVKDIPFGRKDYFSDKYYLIVLPNVKTLQSIEKKQKKLYGKTASSIKNYISFETDGTRKENLALNDKLKEQVSKASGEKKNCFIESRAASYKNAVSLYGGFLFIGVFLSILFVMATILIIYYKQITEGYEDKKRFEIMQKVGMSQHEIKGAIQSQILTVFFLPLLMAGVHIVFAFPIIYRILMMFNLYNKELFILCTIACFVAFAVIYSIVYMLTAKTYYSIVKHD